MSKNALLAVIAGVASAIAALAFVAGVPGAMLLIYAGPLPVMLAGLGFGFQPALLAAATGTLVAAAAIGGQGALLYAVGHALPSLMVVGLALRSRPGIVAETREWYPHGDIVAWLAVLAAAFVAMAGVWLAGEDGFRATVNDHIEKGLGVLLPQLGLPDRQRLQAGMSSLFPGWIGTSWAVMGVVNAVAAETILDRAGRAIRPKPAWGADLSLPDWLSWALVGAATLALIGTLIGPGDVGYMGRNLALVLALPHFLLGLAVVHGLAQRTQQPRAILVGFYVVLFVSAWAMLAVATIGVLEHWIGLRSKMPGGPTKENV